MHVLEAAMDEVTVRLQDAAATLDDLRVLLDGEEELDRVLKRLTETAVRTVPAGAAVSVTVLADEGRAPWTSTATDASVRAIDEVQRATGHGPCVEAARTRRPVRVGVEEIRSRWPDFATAADAAGMRSYLSAPLLLGDEPVLGALNMYSRSPDAFDPMDEALLHLFTAAASAAIVNARRYRRARDLAFHMKAAMDSRAEIEQAKGVLMAQHAITADEAFQRLVSRSQDTNTKLRDVALSLLASLRRSAPSS
jgi:GAF domain-containing protein